jgi:hypothetical protein
MAIAVTVDIPCGTEQQCQLIAAKIFPTASCPRAGWVQLVGPAENG